MEIFLNLVWLALSLLLIAAWLKAVHLGHSDRNWNTVVALGLLLVLLFPVISITDDIVAMTAPAETEHALRRDEAPHLHATPVLSLGGIVLLTWGVVGLIFCLIATARIRPLSFAARLRDGFLRASGVRPPPALLLSF